MNRAAAIDAEEKADEDFVRSIFSKNGDVKVSLGSGLEPLFSALKSCQVSGLDPNLVSEFSESGSATLSSTLVATAPIFVRCV